MEAAQVTHSHPSLHLSLLRSPHLLTFHSHSSLIVPYPTSVPSHIHCPPPPPFLLHPCFLPCFQISATLADSITLLVSSQCAYIPGPLTQPVALAPCHNTFHLTLFTLFTSIGQDANTVNRKTGSSVCPPLLLPTATRMGNVWLQLWAESMVTQW